MIRFLAGVAAALLLVAGGMFLWTGMARERGAPLPAPSAAAITAGESAPPVPPVPPVASEASREEKRFGRYDRDRDGAVSRDEYLAARRKAFARLDSDGDGRLSFEEYAVKTAQKFASADADRSGRLDAEEFAATRVVRKPRAPCATTPAPADDQG